MAGLIKDKEAWREFLIISSLLLVALGMALLSSVVLSQSHIVLSKVLAGMPLLIAILVSIVFVPRLVRRVQWQGGPWPSLGIMKEGSVYLATILIIAMAALNTGNNLLFLILAMLFSAIVASGVISRLSLKGISVSLQIPDHPSAGDPVTFRVALKNHNRNSQKGIGSK
ncbi:MAG: hypothetical protein HYR55_08700 [Acidobacteria bacterium]|nr:hypothetical protein [Acidobacteriota bacterium]